MSYRCTSDDCATCYASIYLVIIIIVDVDGVIESRLRTLPRLQSRKSDYAHFLYRDDAANRVRSLAPCTAAPPPSPPRLSNFVTLMPEIDDISPGEARRSPARCPDDVIIARERVHCRYYFSSPENAIWRDRPARPVNKYMRARRGRSCPPAAM